MLVTAIEALGKKKKKILFDNYEKLALYQREVGRYGIQEGKDFPEEKYEKLVAEVLVPRARKRVLYLLQAMDRTEFQIRKKLKEGFFPEEVIEDAIAYAAKFHYIDDERYIRNYLALKLKKKSRRQAAIELEQKGIDRERIQIAFEDFPDSEEEPILKLAEKRLGNQPEEADILKTKQYLFRKGFSYDGIERGISHYLQKLERNEMNYRENSEIT